MKRFVLAVLVGFAAAALAGQVPAAQLDDPELDEALRSMDGLAADSLPGFMAQVASRFRLRQAELERLRLQEGLKPSEVYMLAFMARTRSMTLERVMELRRSEGSWAGAAERLGLKTGSAELARLRTQAGDDAARLQTQLRAATETRTTTMERSGGGSSASGPKK